MLREGMEAALIVAILLAYLRRLSRPEAARWVWAGTGAAVLVSALAGAVLWATVGELEGTAEAVTEGIVALAAAGVLTWMVFWMGRQARSIRSSLESQVDAALVGGGTVALASIAFIAVVREGFESALFLISTTVGEEARGAQVVGGLLGVAAAVAIGYLVYRGSRYVNLRVFFRITGVLIVLFAAGLIAKGIHEFQEVGTLPVLVEHVWNTGVLDPEVSTAGRFLRSLFGWDAAPSLLMVAGYLAYLIPVGGAFLRMTAPTTRRPEAVTTG